MTPAQKRGEPLSLRDEIAHLIWQQQGRTAAHWDRLNEDGRRSFYRTADAALGVLTTRIQQADQGDLAVLLASNTRGRAFDTDLARPFVELIRGRILEALGVAPTTPEPCPNCRGSGLVDQETGNATHPASASAMQCSACDGYGSLLSEDAAACPSPGCSLPSGHGGEHGWYAVVPRRGAAS